MFHVEPFDPQHAIWMEVQAAQRHESVAVESVNERLNGLAWTLLDDETPVACCGVNDDGMLWGLLSETARKRMALCMILARRLLRLVDRPVYMLADATFPAAHACALAMGFEAHSFQLLAPDRALAVAYVRRVQ